MIQMLIALERLFLRVWNGFALRWRSRYWSHHFGACGTSLAVGGPLTVKWPEHVRAGTGVLIAEGVYLNARATIQLDDHVRLSSFVRINTGTLDVQTPPEARSAHIDKPVHIEKYAWLATGVMVNPGVTIHEGAVVGAGSVVVSDLPAYTLCVGVPAKPIQDLPRSA
jgi:acetyltransferase-like isoleucine patch superfamily enzyme